MRPIKANLSMLERMISYKKLLFWCSVSLTILCSQRLDVRINLYPILQEIKLCKKSIVLTATADFSAICIEICAICVPQWLEIFRECFGFHHKIAKKTMVWDYRSPSLVHERLSVNVGFHFLPECKASHGTENSMQNTHVILCLKVSDWSESIRISNKPVRLHRCSV